MLLKEVGVDPLTLWYEDLIAQPDAAVERVASYLGVATDPASAVAIPEVEKQSQEESRLWAERYSAGSQESGN